VLPKKGGTVVKRVVRSTGMPIFVVVVRLRMSKIMKHMRSGRFQHLLARSYSKQELEASQDPATLSLFVALLLSEAEARMRQTPSTSLRWKGA
jgi:hypothetical protein